MEPSELNKGFESFSHRQQLAEAAHFNQLDPLRDLLFIDRLATRWSLDPDVIYDKSFNWFSTWSITLKMEAEYQERFAEASKNNNTIQPPQQPTE